MKKFFIFAAAAVVAMAACSKVETGTSIGNNKISFQVARYVAQTRAAEDAVALTETDEFVTKAWLHANGAAMGTDFFGTSANSYIDTVSYNGSDAWEPSREYFWPKGAGSYINFVSWFATNSKAPSYVIETSMEWGSSAAPMTIVTDDNILFADEAWRFSSNAETYQYRGVSSGVPTLFHHALAKVAFNVRLATPTESTKTIWDVQIDSVVFKVGNNGYLTLVNADPTSAATTRAWKVGTVYGSGLEATSANIGWARPSVPTLETIVDSAITVSGTQQFARPLFEDFQPTGTKVNGKYVSGDFVEFLAPRTVLPQVIENGVVTFAIYFTNKLYHDDNSDGVKDGAAYSAENLKVDETNLFALVDAIDSWKMNTKYTYNITIDPVGQKVLFDPAVAEWNEVEAEDEIYPRP